MLHAQKIILAALLSAISLSAAASSFQVGPMETTIDSNGNNNTASIEVLNLDKYPINFEVLVSEYSKDGKAVLKGDAKALTLTNKTFTVAPGGKEVIKAKYVGIKSDARDEAFLVLVKEVVETKTGDISISSAIGSKVVVH